MEDKQYWGVCVNKKIVKVYSDYDTALQESIFYTHETQVAHTVKPVIKKKGVAK